VNGIKREAFEKPFGIKTSTVSILNIKKKNSLAKVALGSQRQWPTTVGPQGGDERSQLKALGGRGHLIRVALILYPPAGPPACLPGIVANFLIMIFTCL